jgi:hypothetical protein
VIDGKILPDSPFRALAAGAGRDERVEQLTRVLDVSSQTTRYPGQASQQIWAGHSFDPFTLQR